MRKQRPGKVKCHRSQEAAGQVSLTSKLMMFLLCCSKRKGERRKGRAKGREKGFILTDLK